MQDKNLKNCTFDLDLRDFNLILEVEYGNPLDRACMTISNVVAVSLTKRALSIVDVDENHYFFSYHEFPRILNFDLAADGASNDLKFKFYHGGGILC